MSVAFVYSGLVDYADALLMQEACVARFTSDHMSRLLILEHAPVVTYGTDTQSDDKKLADDMLSAQSIAVHTIGRHGKGTYHGPGQLVVYPILGIMTDIGRALHIGRLETAIRAFLLDYGIKSVRSKDVRHPGVFYDSGGSLGKVASVGVEFRACDGHYKYVTLHGAALNVNIDPAAFDVVYACGEKSPSITSLAKILGHSIDMQDAMRRFVGHFSRVSRIPFDLEKCVG